MPLPFQDLARHRRRLIAILAAAIIGLPILFLLLIGYGWGAARGLVEAQLSARLHRKVSIAAIRREGPISLTPTLLLEDIRVRQPDWAGQGDLARINRLTLRLPVLPLLIGRARPQSIAIDGMRLALKIDKDGRESWRERGPQPSNAAPLSLGDVAIHDATVRLDNARNDVSLEAAVTSDAGGFRMAGKGAIAGAPAVASLQGPAVSGHGAWPFRFHIASPVVTLDLAGTAAAPLDVRHFDGRVTSHGRDLNDLDRIIRAGLPDSQHYTLAGTIRHDGTTWIAKELTGTLGTSDLGGHATIHKLNGRTLIEGDLTSNNFNFDDLATDAQLARGAALARKLGPRLFPPTPIRLDHLRKTDGTVTVTIRHLRFDRPSAFQTLKTTLTLDHGVLTAAPLVAGLTRGQLAGSIVVRHESGTPLLILDTTLTGATLETTVTTPGMATGALAGRIRLQGHGDTFRDAIGHADGRIALVARNGTVERRNALLAGSDVGRALLAGPDERTGLRCMIAGIAVSGGIGRANSLLLDTEVGRSDGGGTVDLASERLDLALRGASKLGAGLKIDEPFRIAGIIKAPELVPPPNLKSAGGILKMVGRSLGGGQPAAAPVDCGALAAKALR